MQLNALDEQATSPIISPSAICHAPYPTEPTIPNYVALNLKPETLARYGLPDIPYRLALDDFMAAVEAGDGALPFALMLVELQDLCEAGDADWLSIEPGIDRLSELLCDGDEPESHHRGW